LLLLPLSYQAAAICGVDVDMRRGAAAWGNDLSFPFVLGGNFVGVIHHCGPVAEELRLRPGM